jgi:hypothetical protein
MISNVRSFTLFIGFAIAAGSILQQPKFEPYRDPVAPGTLVNAAADINGDGAPDLFVGFNGTTNRLFLNDRGALRDLAVAAAVGEARAIRAAAWGDYDLDGDSDLLVGFGAGTGPVLTLYRNGDAGFMDVTLPARLEIASGAVRQTAWVDFDGDDDLDLFVGFRDRPDVLFRNEKGVFTDVAAPVGLADPRKTVGAVWFDYDEDGDLDLYAGHMDGDANGLLRNDSGKFTDVAEAAGLQWGGRAPKDPANGTVRPCAADVDNDGHLDLFMANYGPNGLFLNRGGGKFDDVSAAWGIAIDGRYDTCAFADFDNDGRMDLYVNGTVTGGVSYRDYLFRNTGSRFEDVTPDNLKALAADHGALWADFDRDGDEDLALTGAGKEPLPLVFRNMLPPTEAKRSIKVRVLDSKGRAIRAAAEVRIYEAGTRRLLGTRLVDSGSGYNAQSDIPVHFGLGSTVKVDVEVVWPSGKSRVTSRSMSATASTRAVVVRIP